MNRIEKQVDRIIAGLKIIDSLKGIKFVREYSTQSIEAPIRSMLAVVSVTDTSTSKEYIGGYLSPTIKGDSYAARVEIRIYAPATENGNGLTEITSEILQGLKKADVEKIITDSSATSINFDPDMNGIYRTIEFEIDFCLCEEV